MGLLDGVMGGMGGGRRPGLGDTVAAGAVLALLVKAIRQHQQSQSAGAPAQQPAGGGGLAGGLGGLLGGGGGGGLGGMLSGLGGAGALGALINQFHAKGLGDKANSWVGGGANQPVAPQEVGKVLDESTLNELQARTGLSRDELLQQLAQELPHAVDAATPQGRLPTDDELHRIAS
jgi:uncharacterized protein YidB (DUF937 family)